MNKRETQQSIENSLHNLLLILTLNRGNTNFKL